MSRTGNGSRSGLIALITSGFKPLAACGVLLFLGIGTPASSSPVFDPFAARFMVGTYSEPDDFAMAGGFPAGLIEPPQLDRTWIGAANRCLTANDSLVFSVPLLHRQFLNHMVPLPERNSWLATHKDLIAELAAFHQVRAELPPVSDHPFLRAERYSLAFFQAILQGEPARAADLAGLLADPTKLPALPACERFIWGLRRDLLDVMAGRAQGPVPGLWPGLIDLGSYDANNAWALWLAYCQVNQFSPLPAQAGDDDLVPWLGGLNKARLTPGQIQASVFSETQKAGLGATLLTSKDLAEHFQRHPQPPGSFTLQGWWVKGQRFLKKGQADWYEQLAAREDLDPAWRLDVWRRASELRLLHGQWDPGLVDLDRALALNDQATRSRSLRRRLREWVEQALVLFLAREDPERAAAVYAMGVKYLKGDELAWFREDTSHWEGRLKGISAAPLPAPERLNQAGHLVRSGQAPTLVLVEANRTREFLAAAANPAWELWCRWGLALAESAPESAAGSVSDSSYCSLLRDIQNLQPGVQLENTVAAAVARRFASTTTGDVLLRRSLLLDISRANNWSAPPDLTPLPDLIAQSQGEILDLHALLGFALLTGDMRGSLAATVVMPTRGLSTAEKLRFLYPLPGSGPIRDAVVGAQADPALLLAVARNESLFDPAVRSRAGALGWMQIMPFHYQERGAQPGSANWSQPAASIKAGDALLVENMRRYGGDPYRVLSAYNAGPQAVARWLDQLGGEASPEIFLAWIGYPETRRYVEKVLIDRAIYDWIIAAASSP